MAIYVYGVTAFASYNDSFSPILLWLLTLPAYHIVVDLLYLFVTVLKHLMHLDSIGYVTDWYMWNYSYLINNKLPDPLLVYVQYIKLL